MKALRSCADTTVTRCDMCISGLMLRGTERETDGTNDRANDERDGLTNILELADTLSTNCEGPRKRDSRQGPDSH